MFHQIYSPLANTFPLSSSLRPPSSPSYSQNVVTRKKNPRLFSKPPPASSTASSGPPLLPPPSPHRPSSTPLPSPSHLHALSPSFRTFFTPFSLPHPLFRPPSPSPRRVTPHLVSAVPPSNASTRPVPPHRYPQSPPAVLHPAIKKLTDILPFCAGLARQPG